MGIFDGVLLASDFDNTLLNTEVPRRTGAPVPRLSAGNRAALEYFMARGGRFALATGRALAPPTAPPSSATVRRCTTSRPGSIWTSSCWTRW